MKIRNGFVSNSSTSSFTCAVCGGTESGYDMELNDFEMSCCANGHIIDNECLDQRIYKLIEEEGHKHDFSIEYCPICQFEVLDDRDALKYLYHVLGHSNKDILEDIKKKYGNYDKFKAEINIIMSKKSEEEKIKKEEKK